MPPLNILIVGAGIAGPTLATFLLLSPIPASQKPHITILERSASLSGRGQNIDIRGAGVTIMRKLGLETIIRANTTGEEGVRLVDSQNRTWSEVRADKSGNSPTSDIEILRGRLAEICNQRCLSVSAEAEKRGARGVEYLFGDTLEEIVQEGDGVNVRFKKSGERRTFDVVVGADGLLSQTRRLVWGEEKENEHVKRLGMYAGFFSMPRGDTDSEWRRRWNTTGRRGIMLRPDDRGTRTTVMMSVINEKDPRLADVMADGHHGVVAQKALLEDYFRDAGWECERVINGMKETDDFYYDMVAQIKMEKWSKGRVVLLGDAGYCGSPISGMGTTLGFMGAYELAGAFISHPNDPLAAFAVYEEKMRPVVEKAQKLPPGVLRILFPETLWGFWGVRIFFSLLSWTRVFFLVFKFLKLGPPADEVSVEEYGFEQPSELKE